MVLPRPALLAILGALLIGTVFALTRSTGQVEEEPSAPAPKPAAATAKAEKKAARPAAARPKPAAERPGLPARVERALARKQTVVLFFAQAGASDDAATREAVRAVGRIRNVAVVVDDIRDVSDYRRVVEKLGITQAPAIVVVDRDGKGQVLEGFTDPGSLVQLVKDAR